MVKGAWVTLATNDSYSLGALVLAHSLKQVGTQKELAILVTPGVTTSMRARLFEVFNSVKEVNILDSKDKANLKLLQRPELGITFTKLHCWQLTEYEKCVFLDADTLVLQNCDELFEREELSAAPDVGWPDCFNSGVFVYRPSEDTYNNLIQFALDKGSFDGGDQGLLNLYFSDWARKDISKHLPFIYNVCSTAFYSYLPAFKQFGKDVKIVHFIGNAKPWLQYFDTESKKVRPSRDLGHLEPILQKWWNIFCSMIHPNLTSDMISSYPSDPVSARSPPGQFPKPPETESPVPFDCTNEKPTVWDPWEEYDRNQMNVNLHSPELLESHNTIALNPVASDQSCIDYTNPFLDESIVDRNDQNHDSLSSSNYFNNDQCCIEQFSELCPNESIHFENIVPNINETTEEIPKVNFENVQESVMSFPVPTSPQENIVSAIPEFSEVPITENNSSHSNLPAVTSYETKDINPDEIPSPISHNPSKYETEEGTDNEACGVDTDVEESGLAGAFARLTLGQQRTPEQEALEDSLRRQNWEQGNIDYLGRDSFDNIWSKICQTLAKGPQESEGENSQIKPEDSVLQSPQQESVKEDIVSVSQEAPHSTDSQSVIESQEKPSAVPIPLPSSAEISPDKVPTTGISVSSIPEKIPTPEVEAVAIEPIVAEKTSESKTVPTPTENITEKRSSATEIAVSKIVDQVLSDSEPSTKEVSNVIEQSIGSQSPPQETPKPEIIPLTKPAEEESPKDVLSAEQVGPEKVSVPAPVSSKPEDPKQEEKISESQNISSAEKTNTSSTIQSAPASIQKESSPAVQEIPLSPEIAVCPIKSIPPTGETPPMKETSPQVPTAEQTTKIDAPTTEIIPSTELSSISEKTSAPLEKATAPVEAPKTEQTSSEKTPPLTEKACSLEKVPPKTQATPQQEATSVPIAAEPKTSSSAEPITPPPSTVTATPTLTSSEPPPPITAPPRKNGGKKQNKSKK